MEIFTNNQFNLIVEENCQQSSLHESNVVNTIAKINPNKNPKVNIITSLS